ncbi:FadR/GntR family transcriptional regulator [Frigidibacter sp. ROC022]|uniref:FadR/GntR family transcriptional regulator n=1 Tax=Frigidibacter sp. ROC022 TaxID=2971796 RepID=UPI00215AA207|nr:FCD domain-containing protein [Frigidibacter sp. ROC022]MCR8726095.1 FCD domain-containing protein [Frigidibacter sp. ROC022]
MRLLAEFVEREGLGVGDRLPPEIALAREFGLSRSTVREALRQWESLGIIERNKGAGTWLVSEVSSRSMHIPLTVKIEADSLQRMIAVRRPLEVEAVRLATRNASEAMKRKIMQRMYELMEVYEAGEDWRDADRQFHAVIHEATGNPLFGKIIRQIHGVFHDIYDAPFGQPQLGAATIPVHRDLAEAIVAGEEEKAVTIMERIMSDMDAATVGVAGGSDA